MAQRGTADAFFVESLVEIAIPSSGRLTKATAPHDSSTAATLATAVKTAALNTFLDFVFPFALPNSETATQHCNAAFQITL